MEEKETYKFQIIASNTFWNKVKIARLQAGAPKLDDFIKLLLLKGIEAIKNENKEE